MRWRTLREWSRSSRIFWTESRPRTSPATSSPDSGKLRAVRELHRMRLHRQGLLAVALATLLITAIATWDGAPPNPRPRAQQRASDSQLFAGGPDARDAANFDAALAARLGASPDAY